MEEVCVMGYSCASKAACRIEVISEVCIQQTGSHNVYLAKGKRYFFQVGKEQSDGSITGSIWLLTSENFCKKTANFKICPEGRLVRGPDFFKQIPFFFIVLNGCPKAWLKSYGVPTLQNLQKYLDGYLASFDSGGVNSHIGTRPNIWELKIVDGNTGNVIVEI
jgi:hypothetical protein